MSPRRAELYGSESARQGSKKINLSIGGKGAINQREEFFRDRVSLHTSRGEMDLVSGLAFGSFAEASLKNSSTLDPIVPR